MDEERATLEELVNKGKNPAYKVNHARILLLADTTRSERIAAISMLVQKHQPAIAGYCNKIEVILNSDNSVTVTDNGYSFIKFRQSSLYF